MAGDDVGEAMRQSDGPPRQEQPSAGIMQHEHTVPGSIKCTFIDGAGGNYRSDERIRSLGVRRILVVAPSRRACVVPNSVVALTLWPVSPLSVELG
jgi:hypothetical protein